jgi:RNA polymerase sigma-70 factor (ECF subfamily)
LLHAARADFLRQLGDVEGAKAAYVIALSLTEQEPEKRFLQSQLQSLTAG